MIYEFFRENKEQNYNRNYPLQVTEGEGHGIVGAEFGRAVAPVDPEKYLSKVQKMR